MVVVAVGVRFGVPLYRQHAALAEFERLGAEIERTHGGPQWLRDRLGDEWMRPFDNVARVDLDGTRVADAGMAHLKELTSLEFIGLDGTRVTDAGLAHLKGLTNLRWIALCGTQISDAG